MKITKYAGALLLAVMLAVSWSADLSATKLLHMNLEQLLQNSDRVFTGTLIGVEETTVEAGGGTIRALAYTFKVEQAFKGQFGTQKGLQIAEIRTIGTLKQLENRRPPVPGFPLFHSGQRYLLIVNPDGPAGLTSTAGLGQGSFEIDGREGQEVAKNLFNNAGLFRGMNVSGAPASGPVSYVFLSNLINELVQGGN
ncbi:MAG TPA: hypothetical protein VLU25_10555 [Acidobacteriota bacterium]|nr:hypothetical protein [Acidobacteriota bacterium]